MATYQNRNFIPRNEGFVCVSCDADVPPAPKTFRNHCPACLVSKHVDVMPGDRRNTCGGLMPTVRVEGTDPDMLDLIQQCDTCGHQQRNRSAPDDDRNVALQINKTAV